ncbi:acyl carrier protein [Clostridia bacterium]|nr:acyl carrier protein [Clostridia bacterium]
MKTSEKIISIATEQLEVDFSEMPLDTDLTSLDVDSLDLVELIMAIEQEFEIEISDEEIEEITSLEAAINLVEGKIKE